MAREVFTPDQDPFRRRLGYRRLSGASVGKCGPKVHKYRFLDTHLRLDNENAFQALALDEHRRNFEPTFWTKTITVGQAGAADRPIDKVEQRWFVGAHANVGGSTRATPWRSAL